MNTGEMHTFVIPAYKESPYLDACIRSLLAQTARSTIVLSTSTPSPFLSRKARQYCLPLIVNPKSEGIAADWNMAYQTAQTPFVTLAHQDDIYAPDYTATCLAVAGGNDTVIAFTDYMENVKNTARSYSLLLVIKRILLTPFLVQKGRIRTPGLKKMLLAAGNPICCPTIMYNRRRIRTFFFDPSYKMNLDWEATLRLADIPGDFVYIPRKLLIRRIHPESETSRAGRLNLRHHEDLRIIRKYWPESLASLYFRLYSISHELNN